jgi:hypothetical protein
VAKWVFGALILLVVAGGVSFSLGLIKFSAGVNATRCEVDDEIPDATRNALDRRAMAFTQAVLSQNLDQARGMMTEAARAAMPADQFSALFGKVVAASAPFSAPQVAHSYFVRSAGGGPDGRAICGTLANNAWTSIAIKPGVDQGHVVVSTKSRNNDWAFTYWLLPANGDWRVHYFHMGVSSIVGLTAGQLLERARAERDGGHAFNATLLYAGAQGMADFGPVIQPGVSQPIREDLEKFSAPPEFAGKPPFEWKMNGQTYTVSQASIIGVDRKLGIVFMLPQKEWDGSEGADRFNRGFISAFIATHPDYSRSFSFLVARALKPDNSGGFGTVYENGRGFD